MVVRLRNGKNIRGALSYNEAKVRAGVAELILASRFACDASELSFSQKLKRFTHLNEKCVTSSFNTVHISLNFSAEDNVDSEKMQLIAREYMQELGFEKQPYLVYRHNDTSHPHLHIVTTPVRDSGRTINLHSLVQRRSEPARRLIEDKYQLVKAENRKKTQETLHRAPSAVYGKTETKHAISQIVRTVSEQWQFSDFDQYDLILRELGVCADRGREGDRLHSHKGLNYFVVDRNGKKCSVPIKASTIYGNPTIVNIEKKFSKSSFRKERNKHLTENSIRYLSGRAPNQSVLTAQLRAKGIQICDCNGKLYILDSRFKTIYESSELNLPDSFKLDRQVIGEQESPDLSVLKNLFSHNFTGPDLASAFLKRKKKRKR